MRSGTGESVSSAGPRHIDQQIATTDQVEPGKRRISDHVLLGKDQYVAEDFLDAVGAGFRLLVEKSRQSFRRDIGGDAGGINAGACLFNRLAIKIGGKHLQFEVLLQRLRLLLEQHGKGIGFLARGTAGYPDTDRCALALAHEKSSG